MDIINLRRVALVLIACTLSPGTFAKTVFADSQLIVGSLGTGTVSSFEAAAGSYRATLTDLGMLDPSDALLPFDELLMTVATATSLEGTLVDAGTFDFTIDGSALTTLFVNVLGSPGGAGPITFGQYGVQIVSLDSMVLPTPIPGAVALLGSALLGVSLVARRRG